MRYDSARLTGLSLSELKSRRAGFDMSFSFWCCFCLQWVL